MGEASIKDNVDSVMERVRSAVARAGRRMEDITVVAVSKFHPAAEIDAVYGCGMRVFGESRVQEASGKFPSLLGRYPDMRVHMLGHLQSNKAKDAAGLFSCVQSLDSAELARKLSKAASASGRNLDVLCEVHTGEESKSGFRRAEDLWRCLDELPSLPGIVPVGLMTMAPYTRDQDPIRASFRALSALGEEWRRRYPGLGLPVLSMGMSNDYEIAIEEGSTMLRIGTALFGERTA